MDAVLWDVGAVLEKVRLISKEILGFSWEDLGNPLVFRVTWKRLDFHWDTHRFTLKIFWKDTFDISIK